MESYRGLCPRGFGEARRKCTSTALVVPPDGIPSDNVANPEDCELTEAEKERNLLLFTILYFVKIFANILVITTGPVIASRHFAGDTPKALEALNLVTSVAAALEFVVNPFWGSLSDQIGRKIFLVVGSLISGIAYISVAISPSLWVYVALRLAITVLPIFSTYSAAMADMFAKDSNNYAKKNARLQAWSGLGVVLGSAIGGQLSTIDVRLPYAISGVLTSLSVVVGLSMKETHGPCKRKKMSLAKLNPFSFVSLFQKGSLFTRLNLITMLQTVRLYMGDVFQVFLREMLSWGPAIIGKVYSILGVISILGGFFAGTALRVFGAYGLSIGSTTMVALAFLIYGFVKTPFLFFVALACGAPGTLCSIAPNSIIVRMGGEMGMNFGELTSARSNLNAVSRVISPLIFSKLYSIGYHMNVPGLPFFVVGGFIALANVLLLSTRNSNVWRTASGNSPRMSGAG